MKTACPLHLIAPSRRTRRTWGLSRLTVEWVKAGITLERSRPGHPQDNGRHERMHRTLKAETASPPATDRVEQQRRFDRFRAEYNCERPHQALGQRTATVVSRATR